MHLTRRYGISTRIAYASIAVAAVVSVACGDSSTAPAQPQVWGSDQANLAVQDGTSTFRIFNSGSCYGYFGDIAQAIPDSQFNLPGALTQFIGIPPGQRKYDAQFVGTVNGAQLTITVTVPALQQSFGPYVLTRGVSSTKPQCLYP